MTLLITYLLSPLPLQVLSLNSRREVLSSALETVKAVNPKPYALKPQPQTLKP